MERPDILDGLRDALPTCAAVAPFATVFGALASQAGWSPGQVLLASGTIYAGASQFVALDLWGRAVPAWTIVLTVLAVNFRHVLYSASIGRRMKRFGPLQKAGAFALLVDPTFAAAEARARGPGLSPSYYFAYALALGAVWMAANAAGIAFGRLIEDPAALGLDFILPIYFLGLVVSMRRAPRFASIVLVSAATAIVVERTLGAPWHILAGGVAGMAWAALAVGGARGPTEARGTTEARGPMGTEERP